MKPTWTIIGPTLVLTTCLSSIVYNNTPALVAAIDNAVKHFLEANIEGTLIPPAEAQGTLISYYPEYYPAPAPAPTPAPTPNPAPAPKQGPKPLRPLPL